MTTNKREIVKAEEVDDKVREKDAKVKKGE
jgi:hypothetical protein